MKQKFHLEIVLLGIVSIISLVSILGIQSFEAAATINGINEDTSPFLNILRQAGNTTVTNGTSTITIGIGPNVLITNGKSQIVSKTINFTAGSKLSLLGSSVFSPINLGILSADPSTTTNGDLWLISGGTNVIKYKDSTGSIRVLITTNNVQTLLNKKIQDTNSGFVNTVDQTKQLKFDVSPVATGHTVTWSIQNANTTFMGTTITNDLKNTGSVKIGSGNLIMRNPAASFATTIANGAQYKNNTLNLPIIKGTSDTVGLLNTSATWTQPQQFGSSNLLVENPAKTRAITIAASAITSNATLTLPNTFGNSDTFAVLNTDQTYVGAPTFSNGASFNNDVSVNNAHPLRMNGGALMGDGTNDITGWKNIGVSPNGGHLYLDDTVHLSFINASNAVITINSKNSAGNSITALKLSGDSPHVQFLEHGTIGSTSGTTLANVPTGVNSAQFGWIKVKDDAGNTVYIPTWK